MKVDIEENIESIVGQIDSSTFEQCVGSYREKIDTLKAVAQDYTHFIGSTKCRLEQVCQQSYQTIQSDIDDAIKIEGIEFAEQNMLCNEGFQERQEQKGPIRALFQGQNRRRNHSTLE